jgi:hypothetical protein
MGRGWKGAWYQGPSDQPCGQGRSRQAGGARQPPGLLDLEPASQQRGPARRLDGAGKAGAGQAALGPCLDGVEEAGQVGGHVEEVGLLGVQRPGGRRREWGSAGGLALPWLCAPCPQAAHSWAAPCPRAPVLALQHELVQVRLDRVEVASPHDVARVACSRCLSARQLYSRACLLRQRSHQAAPNTLSTAGRRCLTGVPRPPGARVPLNAVLQQPAGELVLRRRQQRQERQHGTSTSSMAQATQARGMRGPPSAWPEPRGSSGLAL